MSSLDLSKLSSRNYTVPFDGRTVDFDVTELMNILKTNDYETIIGYISNHINDSDINTIFHDVIIESINSRSNDLLSMYVVSYCTNLRVFEYLYNKGIHFSDTKDVEINNYQCTMDRNPIHCACYVSTVDVVKFIYEKHPDQINTQTYSNNSCIEIACEGGNIDIIEFLIEKGVSPFKSIPRNHHSRPKSSLLELLVKSKRVPLSYLIKFDKVYQNQEEDDLLYLLCLHNVISKIEYPDKSVYTSNGKNNGFDDILYLVEKEDYQWSYDSFETITSETIVWINQSKLDFFKRILTKNVIDEFFTNDEEYKNIFLDYLGFPHRANIELLLSR